MKICWLGKKYLSVLTGVRIKRVEFRENVRVFFPQEQSKLSVITRTVITILVVNWQKGWESCIARVNRDSGGRAKKETFWSIVLFVKRMYGLGSFIHWTVKIYTSSQIKKNQNTEASHHPPPPPPVPGPPDCNSYFNEFTDTAGSNSV